MNDEFTVQNGPKGSRQYSSVLSYVYRFMNKFNRNTFIAQVTHWALFKHSLKNKQHIFSFQNCIITALDLTFYNRLQAIKIKILPSMPCGASLHA